MSFAYAARSRRQLTDLHTLDHVAGWHPHCIGLDLTTVRAMELDPIKAVRECEYIVCDGEF
jgi:hypothetical protein